MRFTIPINEPDPVNGSVTCYVVDCGNVSERVAKRKLREFLTVLEVPRSKQKKFINDLLVGN